MWRYSYDPFGRRIGKTCIQRGSKQHRQITNVNYLWSSNLLSEEHRIYADGTEQTVAYHYEQDSFRPIAQEVDGKLTYIVTDHLGTPKELLTEAGDMVWSARHELWGKVTAHQQAANDDTHECLLRFQGQIEDKESGFYYNRFRYYEPDSGNYACADPIGLQGGLTTHRYVGNPNGWIDPLGLASKCADVPNTKLLTGQVEYGSTDLSKVAIQYAKTEKIKGARNVAVFEYTDLDGSVNTIARASQRGKGHSEKLIAEALRECGIPNENVLRIYSELAPCSAPGGFCKNMIEQGSKKSNLGPFNNAKVTYSIEYGGTPHDPAKAAKGVEELRRLRELYNQDGNN